MLSDSVYDVVLIFPSETIRIFDPMLPLGLASIASFLEMYGYNVKLVDLNLYEGDLSEELTKWNPVVIGISGTTPTRKESFNAARLCKKLLPGSITIYGGPHASFTAADSLSHVPEIDYVVRGEGEYVMLSLCDYFIRKKNIDLKQLKGLSYRQGTEIISVKQERITNLDSLPVARRSFGYEVKMDFIDLPADYIITSRGCPVCCTFCSASSMFPGGVKYRSAEHIKKEIDYILENKQIKALKIFDSTFTSSRKHVLDFCRMIKPYNLLWECEVRADSVDKELLNIMKESGCYYIDLGLETTNPQLLKKLGKNIRVEQIENILNWCHEINIKVKLFLIFGLLDQSFEDCKRDLAYLKANRDKISLFGTTLGLRVYPGTALEKQLKKRNLLPYDFSWAGYKRSVRNLILFETSDTMLLEQKHLSHFKLLYLLLLLFLQRTLLSKENILKLLFSNSRNLISSLLPLTRTLLMRKSQMDFNKF